MCERLRAEHPTTLTQHHQTIEEFYMEHKSKKELDAKTKLASDDVGDVTQAREGFGF